MKIANPLNPVQVEFSELCAKGGGAGGGPARGKVQELLHSGSKTLNKMAYDEISHHLKTFPDANPWQVCFAVGLGWGHLAQIAEDFTVEKLEKHRRIKFSECKNRWKRAMEKNASRAIVLP